MELLMSDFQIEVLLQLQPELTVKRVEVSPRQLHFLDRNSKRSFASDGTVLYSIDSNVWHQEEWNHNVNLVGAP